MNLFDNLQAILHIACSQLGVSVDAFSLPKMNGSKGKGQFADIPCSLTTTCKLLCKAMIKGAISVVFVAK